MLKHYVIILPIKRLHRYSLSPMNRHPDADRLRCSDLCFLLSRLGATCVQGLSNTDVDKRDGLFMFD